MRLIGWEPMRESTFLNQANGSTPARWQEATKLRNTAAVSNLERPASADDTCAFQRTETSHEGPQKGPP
jgi:hypothetical protein